MKKTLGLMVLTLMLFIQCGKKVQTVPKTVISFDQMIPLLVDVHLIEGARNGSLILGDTNDIEDYYAKVYQKHGITEDQFKKSFKFYSSYPELFIPIYEKVLDSLKIDGSILTKNNVELEFDT